MNSVIGRRVYVYLRIMLGLHGSEVGHRERKRERERVGSGTDAPRV